MTLYNEIKRMIDELENSKKNAENFDYIQNVNSIISKLTVALKDKALNKNESLQGGKNDINAHLQVNTDVKYNNIYDDSAIRNLMDQGKQIIRDAEAKSNNKKEK